MGFGWSVEAECGVSGGKAHNSVLWNYRGLHVSHEAEEGDLCVCGYGQ